jgi:lysophospholipase L1-like esterase
MFPVHHRRTSGPRAARFSTLLGGVATIVVPSLALPIRGGDRVPLPSRTPGFADFDARAKEGRRLNVVFFGASLTWGANATDHARTSYRALVGEMLEERYPKAHFKFHDAAIGGPGSQLGLFRLERDVLRWNPDLVFLDFSANDDINSDDPETLASYEAIVRRLVMEAKVPVVQVIFPFKWNINAAELPRMKRRTAHAALSQSYQTGLGDAIQLIIQEVARKAHTVEGIWDTDGVHPGDLGYRLFAQAAWQGFREAVEARRVCRAPEKMIYAETYMNSARVRLATFEPLPDGWKIGKPNLTACNYDWLMSRWLDDLVCASSGGKGNQADGKAKLQPVGNLKLKVNASTILLFGESTPGSGRFRVLLDGQPVRGRPGQIKDTDLFEGNRWGTGNGFLLFEVARGLDAAKDHLLEITPVFASEKPQELRIESVCVAGGRAAVELIK